MTVLLEEAQRLGVQIQLGHDVETIDFDTPSVTLRNGEVHKADVVVGCDGTYESLALLTLSI